MKTYQIEVSEEELGMIVACIEATQSLVHATRDEPDALFADLEMLKDKIEGPVVGQSLTDSEKEIVELGTKAGKVLRERLEEMLKN